MKPVILVNPRVCSKDSMRLPLSLLSLAAVLEGRYDYFLIDGNVDDPALEKILGLIRHHGCGLLGLTVMPGPQVQPAIEIASAVRKLYPEVPIVWGGYFPTMYTHAAINADYVDYVVRGQGEDTLLDLLAVLPDAGPPQLGSGSSAVDCSVLGSVRGLTWKQQHEVIDNADRTFRPPDAYPPYPYHRLDDVPVYLRPSFMGSRTAVHQAAIGCRFRCSFCGVVSMFNGYTRLPAADRLQQSLDTLRGYGANALQFYDHNFFDREADTIPLLEVLTRNPMPWWCYARADALSDASDTVWKLIGRSRMKMAYIGAEAASDEVLKKMRKGTRTDQALITAEKCRKYGVIPEFSFVLGGPDDPEGEIERNFRFIRELKKVHPQCEVVLYFYSPTPQRGQTRTSDSKAIARLPELESYGPGGLSLPATPEEWTERQWLDFVCHRDAPWLTPGKRQRVKDFVKVLSCRYPTVQDYSTPEWGKQLLRALSSWRYTSGRYGRPWELDLARRYIRLRIPQEQGL